MDLFNHVAILLQTQQSVGVEGLGTFYNEYIPGTYDEEQESFLPPKVQIAYKEDIEQSEVLQNYLIEHKGISENEAKEWIENDIQKVNTDLIAVGRANLYPLGFLKMGSQGKYIEPIEDQSPDHTYFGLPKLNIEHQKLDFGHKIEAENTVIEPDAPKEKVLFTENLTEDESIEPEAPKKEEPQTEESTPEDLTGRDDQDIIRIITEKYEGKTEADSTDNEGKIVENEPKKYGKWIAIIAILLSVIGGLLYLFFQKPNLVKSWFSAENKPVNNLILGDEGDTVLTNVNSKLIADSTKNIDSTKLIDSDQLKLQAKVNKYMQDAPSQVDTFQVIIGSFQGRKQAITFMQSVKSKGIKASIAYGAPGVRTKVASATFTDQDSANRYKVKMEKMGYKSPWILTKKAK